MKNSLEKKFRRKDQQAEKDRKGNRTRQKNKRGDSKVESNDSPEIPDRGETSLASLHRADQWRETGRDRPLTVMGDGQTHDGQMNGTDA